MSTPPKHYASAVAFRVALETRLKRMAQEEALDLHRLRRQAAFDRLLCRLFAKPDAPWLLKRGYYNSLESVLHEMAQLNLGEGLEHYPRFRERIQRLGTHADQIGWGYGDALRDQIHLLEDELAAE